MQGVKAAMQACNGGSVGRIVASYVGQAAPPPIPGLGSRPATLPSQPGCPSNVGGVRNAAACQCFGRVLHAAPPTALANQAAECFQGCVRALATAGPRAGGPAGVHTAGLWCGTGRGEAAHGGPQPAPLRPFTEPSHPAKTDYADTKHATRVTMKYAKENEKVAE